MDTDEAQGSKLKVKGTTLWSKNCGNAPCCIQNIETHEKCHLTFRLVFTSGVLKWLLNSRHRLTVLLDVVITSTSVHVVVYQCER